MSKSRDQGFISELFGKSEVMLGGEGVGGGRG